MAYKIGNYKEQIDQVDSTNNYASMLLLTKRPPEGTVIVAKSQTGGRGQGKNKWESEPYHNLTFSIILYPKFVEVTKQFEISKAISLGVADFLREFTEKVSIKWPNDIYIGKCKVAGILMEYTILKEKISSCIVGIGLNINQVKFTSDAPNPVSLSQVTGMTYNLEECLTRLLQKLDTRYQLLAGRGADKIDREYEQLLYQKDEWAVYSSKGEDFEGRILGVDKNGLLKIGTRQQTVLKFDYKEVSFIM
jgi:BirA family biotin operon repressor/biotin-[acetyl-CoA-carboxylase] ligase